MDCGPPGSSVHGESPGKNIGVGLVCSLPGDLPNPGIEPRSPTLQADSLPSQPPGKSWLILGAAFGTRGNKELICSWGKHPSWQVHLESLMGLVRLAPFWRMRSRVLECQDAAHQVPLPSLWFSHANLLLCVLLPSWKLWLTRHSSWSSWSLRCPALPRKHIGHFLPVLTALATGPTFAHPPRSSPSPVSPDPCSALLWVSYQSKPCMALLSCPVYASSHIILLFLLCCQHWMSGPPGLPYFSALVFSALLSVCQACKCLSTLCLQHPFLLVADPGVSPPVLSLCCVHNSLS